ncbi:asparagine synthase-related protein [Falsibacillus pallidus]|uniref:asparagine synthase (glutamine-hydrolyzing) n=1 Tax=Falsibacillus pallidus TaxID=493781 RepID=A0A370GT43_9BACI|nr:asparagine synthase-related protein [Falsibacillus pallidus]RDI45694.1 asparagine synthase (glutamine-hydrolysing) [Falsibacillus pallidus]
MSAIAGIYHFNNEPIPAEDCCGMMNALKHFPANDIKAMSRSNIFLGCHAQWITPESIGEVVPYYDYERQLAITSDAIIDNRAELFEMLQIDKDERKSMPDSKLILLAYSKWGEETPKHLIGDFAFMIWDEKNQKLFGARDFSGTRTLYYYKDYQRMAFCTTIKPLLTLPYVEKELNEQWIAEFLAIPVRADSVDTSSTVYKRVNQIPPSHSVTVENGKISFNRYCKLNCESKIKLKSNGEYEEAFREVFQRAVDARLRTHRSVGAHLSGGLDSGSVVSFAAKSLAKENKKLHTFSYVPVDDFVDWTPRYRVADERPLIKSTVNYVGNIEDNYLNFADQNSFTEIDDWLELLEMPYKSFENSFWIKGIYEKVRNQDIGVLLNGQRGNWTISWGPVLDYNAILLKRMHLLKLYKEVRLYAANVGVTKSRVLSFVGKKAYPQVAQHFSKVAEYENSMMINPDFASRSNVIEKIENEGIKVSGNLSSAYEVRNHQFEKSFFWNLNGVIGSKMSLRYSVWERDPTNDLDVIRFCLSVPEHQYVQNGLDRSLIRRATKNYLPDNIRLNQRTRGIQGTDGIHRMKPFWAEFIHEIEKLMLDEEMKEYLNISVLSEALAKLRHEPKENQVFDSEFRILMRSLIFYRFMKKNI